MYNSIHFYCIAFFALSFAYGQSFNDKMSRPIQGAYTISAPVPISSSGVFEQQNPNAMAFRADINLGVQDFFGLGVFYKHQGLALGDPVFFGKAFNSTRLNTFGGYFYYMQPFADRFFGIGRVGVGTSAIRNRANGEVFRLTYTPFYLAMGASYSLDKRNRFRVVGMLDYFRFSNNNLEGPERITSVLNNGNLFELSLGLNYSFE